MNDKGQTPTFGQKAVGLSFNPGGNENVNTIKTKYADVIDHHNSNRANAEDPEVKRMYALAITHAQEAQMWAVKAATWGL